MIAGNPEADEIKRVLLVRLNDVQQPFCSFKKFMPLLGRSELKLHLQLRQMRIYYLSHSLIIVKSGLFIQYQVSILHYQGKEKQRETALFSQLLIIGYLNQATSDLTMSTAEAASGEYPSAPILSA